MPSRVLGIQWWTRQERSLLSWRSEFFENSIAIPPWFHTCFKGSPLTSQDLSYPVFISLSFSQPSSGDLCALNIHRVNWVSLCKPRYIPGQLAPSTNHFPIQPSSQTFSLSIFIDSWVCQGGQRACEALRAECSCWILVYSLYSDSWHRVWSTLFSLAGQRCCDGSWHCRSGLDSHRPHWRLLLKKQATKAISRRDCPASNYFIH